MSVGPSSVGVVHMWDPTEICSLYTHPHAHTHPHTQVADCFITTRTRIRHKTISRHLLTHLAKEATEARSARNTRRIPAL